jgi:hypothetical protein
MKRIDVGSVFEVEGESARGTGWEAIGQGGDGRGVELLLLVEHPQVASERLRPTRRLNSLPGRAEQIPPGLALQM